MTKPATEFPSGSSMDILSRLLISDYSGKPMSSTRAKLKQELAGLDRKEFDHLLALAQTNHVVIRGMEVFLDLMREQGDRARFEWAENALEAEHSRIETAVIYLGEICSTFQKQSFNVAVIKTLDHWPDFGSDIDLFTDAEPRDICALFHGRFDAQTASRSWGDRLAGKWNFMIPGLPEAVEVHMGRLGQTGEQVAIGSSLLQRSRSIPIGDSIFRVPSASDRLMISTLQRMYRHFYFRLCDVVDSGSLVDSNAVDFDDLCASSKAAGIWEGVATYLVIVSDYIAGYRGSGLNLPRFVTDAARFGGREIYYGRGFLRVPIMPQSMRLYGAQLAGILAKKELVNGARLSLLPWLATAAVVGQKLTGSDKGIW